jgi:hypothetical protein
MGEFEEFRAEQHEAGVGLGIDIDDEDPAILARQPGSNIQGTRRFPNPAFIVHHRDNALGDWAHTFHAHVFMKT